MKATELLTELRPTLDESPEAEATLERILLADRPPARPPRGRRYTRPLAVAGVTAVAATAAVALVPSDSSGPVGLAGAVAALTEPDVLLHFKVTTRHAAGGVETAETWQTPDGRRMHTIYGNGLESVYDQRARIYENYTPERNDVIVQTDSEFFEDEEHPFGSISTDVTSGVTSAGDLPGLVTRALGGQDPKLRYVGRTTIDGVAVDQIRVFQDLEVADVPPGAPLKVLKNAPTKTVTLSRDVYVRHDNALPVRVVDHLEALFGDPDATSTTDFTDVQKLTLDATTEPMLELDDHPGAKRIVRGPFDDSKADSGR
jgi:hypothetical protein